MAPLASSLEDACHSRTSCTSLCLGAGVAALDSGSGRYGCVMELGIDVVVLGLSLRCRVFAIFATVSLFGVVGLSNGRKLWLPGALFMIIFFV